MFYVGLDIHSKQIAVCVPDGDGKVYQRCQARQIDQMLRLLERLPGPWRVCYEASTGYGMYFDPVCPATAARPGGVSEHEAEKQFDAAKK